jgi:hypothetical protein
LTLMKTGQLEMERQLRNGSNVTNSLSTQYVRDAIITLSS